ncbi:hypothetical protein [Arthrobacter crystallopoietes]|uniref:Uncharacterized protein n=1 Tax=Crystallibacter crystallopoietes TaxID=37928 RepID=A0A1H1F4H5_9MICC|nr:hypothetical protein [Arthrobacter crystallopoietes]SDQ95902.1 hypothetical protein SAMN04489742_3250 [Arthrobacter crystallopoietes]
MASADTGYDTENQLDETITQVTGNGTEDTGNISLGDFLNGNLRATPQAWTLIPT